jgi:hypothetical protein
MAEKKKKGKRKPRSRRGGQLTKTIPATALQFLHLLEEGFGQRAAARVLRIPETSVTMLLRRPDVIEMRKNIREEMAGIPRQERMKQALAEIDHGRAELCEMAAHGEGEKKKGRLRACSLLLQSHGLIDAPGPKAFSASQSGATASLGTMEEIYKSQWLRDKEAALAQRFEQELLPKQQLNP